MHKYGKFAILIAIIVGSLLWLATAGIGSSQTYYKTISELQKMGPASALKTVRVGGDIQAKCASKYAPKPGMAPEQLQKKVAGSLRSSL